MNCKPGDLAITVRSRTPKYAGRLVSVVERVALGEKRSGWRAHDADCWLVRDSQEEWLHSDSRLRPIRDPGEDAVDEMLRPLPVEEDA